MKTYTGGDIIVENIKVGDVQWEIEYGKAIKVEVLSLPQLSNNQYTWQSKVLSNGEIIEYLVTIGHTHYAPKLYSSNIYNIKEL